MTVFSAFASGLEHVFRNKRILLILLGFNLVFAYLAVLPLKSSFGGFLQDRPIAEILRAQPDMLYFQEWIFNESQTFAIFGSLLLIIAVCYWIFNIYTTGGILGAFSKDATGAPLALRFFGSGAEYFGPLLRLGLLALGFYLTVILLFTGLYQEYDGEFSYTSLWIKNAALFGFSFFAATTFNLISDYAKMHIVSTRSGRAIQALIDGARFVFRLPARTFGLYYANLGLLFLAFAVYFFVDSLITAVSTFTIIVVFVVHQAVMIVRILIRMQFFGSELEMFLSNRSNKTEPLRAEIGGTEWDQVKHA